MEKESKKYCPYVSGIDGVALGFTALKGNGTGITFPTNCDCGAVVCINVIRNEEFINYCEYYKFNVNEKIIMSFYVWKSFGMELKNKK